MALNIIIGDATTEKSDRLCSMAVEQSLGISQGKIIVIVPEQATLLMQKKIIDKHPLHATDNIEIVSFNYLAHMVFSELGQSINEVLDDTGKSLILKKVLRDVADDLKVYKRKAHMTGFVNEVRSMVSELSQYGIDDNDLFLMQEAVEEKGNRLLYAKLDDIRLIYRRFNEAVADRYTTAEDIPDIFAKLVNKSDVIKDASIYLDGFTGFTPIQYKLLKEFLLYAADLTLTITLPEEEMDEECPEHELFYLSNDTLKKISRLAEETGNERKVIVCNERKTEEPARAMLYAASTYEDEVIYTAKKILHLVKNKGLRFKDIAIIVSDMDTYHRIVSRIFDEADIPYFIDHKKDLSDNSLSRYIKSVIRLIDERFSFDTVFSVLKTGFTSLTVDEINLLENYCLEFGIRGIRQWKNDFVKNRKPREYWDLEQINEIRKKVYGELKGFYESLKGTNSGAEYREALQELFRHNDIEQKTKDMAAAFSEAGMLVRAEEYEQIFEDIKELIDKVGGILASEKLTAGEYLDILSQGLSDMKVGIAPPSIDTVVVGDLTRTRTDDIKAMFMIGSNEDKIPQAQGGSLIFTQREREFLKAADFEIAPTRLENIYIQRFYIYLAVSKPKDHLYITYAQLAADGTSLVPSYIVTTPGEIAEDVIKDENEEAKGETWKSLELMKLSENITSPEESAINYFAKEDPLRLSQMINGAFFTNKENRLDKKIAEGLYGEILKGSVSRYEVFNECPFKYFVQYGLHFEERPEYEVKAFDIGNIYHDSLEIYSNRLAEKGFTFRNVSDADSKAIIKEALEGSFEKIDNEALLSTAKSAYMLERISSVTEKTVNILREHVRLGKYEPAHFEWKFTTEPTDGLSFNGKIDRVDIYDGEDVFVKIIDYKSGAKKFDISDIYTGTQLQLVAYMGEALDKVKEENPDRNVYPGGVYYYLVRDSYVDEGTKPEVKHAMNGLTNCSKEALSAIDTSCNDEHPGTSSVTGISFTKKGSRSSKSIANTEEFNNLIDFVKEKMNETGRKIKDGNVDIAPIYLKEGKTSCTYCDYKDICKFEDEKFGVTFDSRVKDKTPKEIEEEIYRKKKSKLSEKEDKEKK